MTAAFTRTERIVARLRRAGLSAAQGYSFARLLADVRREDFDPALAHRDLVGSGYTDAQARVLIEIAVETAVPPSGPAPR